MNKIIAPLCLMFAVPLSAQTTLEVVAAYTAHITPSNVVSANGVTIVDVGTNRNRGLLTFDLSGLPNGAQVSDCYLTLFCNQAIPDPPTNIGYEPAVGFFKDPTKVKINYGDFPTAPEYCNDIYWEPVYGTHLVGTFTQAGRTAVAEHAGALFVVGLYPHNTPGYGIGFAGKSNSSFPKPTLRIIYTTGAAKAANADFYADKTQINQGQSVQFYDHSRPGPITSWLWEFGDGTTSNQKNPLHRYDSAGTFTVKLTATNSGGSGTKTRVEYITVNPKPKILDFSASKVKTIKFDTLKFSAQISFGPATLAWDFAVDRMQGFYTSTDTAPRMAYVDTGTYSVRLIISGPAGKDTLVKTAYIQVLDSLPAIQAPRADYAYVINNWDVVFTDQSSNEPDTWHWDFGKNIRPGTWTSNLKNPVHTYDSAGIYSICLKVGNSAGQDSICKEIFISGQDSTSGLNGSIVEDALFWPNPVLGEYLFLSSKVLYYQLFSSTGRLMREGYNTPESHEIRLPNGSGIWWLHVRLSDQQIKNYRLMVY